MAPLMMDKTREIIDDFAAAINTRKTKGPKPTKHVINFRTELSNGIERDVYEVPLELLRYRKDNGRIASDVLSYEKTNLLKLDEKDSETQKILFEFLKNSDPEDTEILKKSIQKSGQSDPVIITCDGFLINGNRRKMVLTMLHEQDPTKYTFMKVVILPGKNDPGGPPTNKEIEMLENRYQLQRDGKAEYTGLNRALSIKRKMAFGITLEVQLKDDPMCSGMSAKEFQKAVEKCRRDYLLPLEQAEAYLEQLDRPGHYDSIKDRWQAFIDFSNFFNGKLQDKAWQLKADITEHDIGKVQDVAFKIIRKRTVKGKNTKLHQIIRDLPKFLENPDSKKSIYIISEHSKELSSSEKFNNVNQRECSFKDQDEIWGKKNEAILAQGVNHAYSCKDNREENENPLALMKVAYKKLTHSNMVVQNIPVQNFKDFVKEAESVIKIATNLKAAVWEIMKNSRKA